MNSCDLSQVFRKQPFVAFYAPSISAIKIETHQFILILSASCFCWLKFSDSFLYFIFFWSYGPVFQNISLLSPLENFVTHIFITKTKFSPSYGLPMKRYHKSAGKDDAYNEIFIADIKKSLWFVNQRDFLYHLNKLFKR